MVEKQDNREELRSRVAAQYGLQLYKRYSEREAADAVGWHYSTLKRKRRARLVPFVDLGSGSVAYMGYHIADIILFGVKAKEPWAGDERCANSNAATGGSAPRPAGPDTFVAGPKAGRSSASALAQAILTKRRSG
jgi:hypothetical protein